MTPEALDHLRNVDPVLRRIIDIVGPCPLKPQKHRTPFESLVRAVAHQQLNGTAAESILGRFLKNFPGKRFPTPRDVAKVSDDVVRACGFSRAKIAAIRDISAKTSSGLVPTSSKISRLTDAEIIERLIQCRGVGRWTVEMLLMFKLGRPDVLPVDDFGIREGYKLAFQLSEQPRPKELQALGEKWSPFRTTAAWYLWRAVDLSKEGRLHPPSIDSSVPLKTVKRGKAKKAP